MHSLLLICLFLSGATSLIYELLWTRIFSFSFGTTSLAFAIILAVFFLGLAGGSALAGKFAPKTRNPFLAYGLLEGAIGLGAAALFPLLFQLHHVFSLVNAPGTEPVGLALRFFTATLLLALPTFAMGATFPVLLEHLQRQQAALHTAVGRLYGINTLGAFFGVYLATHWLIPRFGLQGAYFTAVALNLAIAVCVWTLHRRNNAQSLHPAFAAGDVPDDSTPAPAAKAEAFPADKRLAAIGLIFLATSGFTTLGYEIAWSRVFTITMEGSLYAVGSTLGAFLVGIGLGGLLFSWLGQKLRTPARLFHAYVLACLVMTLYLAAARVTLPMAGYFLKAITLTQRDLLGLHLNFFAAAIFLLPITTALGFLFPLALSLFNHGKSAWSSGAGFAYALNTLCSVAGSLLTAAYLMEKFGIEGIVLINVFLLLGTLILAILAFEEIPRSRWLWLSPVLLLSLYAGTLWPEINAKSVLAATRSVRDLSPSQFFQSLASGFQPHSDIKLYKDGVGSTLSLTLNGRTYGVQSNGLPQSGRSLDPPHFNFESTLVGLYPLLHHPQADSALVIGLGAGVTVGVLRAAEVPKVTAIELEPSMPAFCKAMYPAGESPLDDPGVSLVQDDARNFFTRNLHAEQPQAWPLIASQPAHPWVSGAADLFTEEMFSLVYRSLSEGGVFGQWFMPSGIDSTGFYAILNAFARVFDEVTVYRVERNGSGIFFVGHKGPRRLDLKSMQALLVKPKLRPLLASSGHSRPANFLQYTLIPTRAGASVARPGLPINRDRNAWVESRMPLISKSQSVLGLKLSPDRPGLRLDMFGSAAFAESLEVFRAFSETAELPEQARLQALPDTGLAQALENRARYAEGAFSDWCRLLSALAGGRAGAAQLHAWARTHPRAGGPPTPEQNANALHSARSWAARSLGWDLFGATYSFEPDLDFSLLSPSLSPEFAKAWLLHAFESHNLPAAPPSAAGADTLHADLLWVEKGLMARNPALQDGEGKASRPTPAFTRLYAQVVDGRDFPRRLGTALLTQADAAGWAQEKKVLEALRERAEDDWVRAAWQKLEQWEKARHYAEGFRLIGRILAARPEDSRAWVQGSRLLGLAGDSTAQRRFASQAQALLPGDEVLAFRMREAFDFARMEAQAKKP